MKKRRYYTSLLGIILSFVFTIIAVLSSILCSLLIENIKLYLIITMAIFSLLIISSFIYCSVLYYRFRNALKGNKKIGTIYNKYNYVGMNFLNEFVVTYLYEDDYNEKRLGSIHIKKEIYDSLEKNLKVEVLVNGKNGVLVNR